MGSEEEPDTGRRAGMGLPVQPPKPGKAMSVFVLLVGLGMVGVGGYVAITDTATLDNKQAVTAEVTALDIEEVSASRGSTAYVPVVTFRYTFQGMEYASDRLYPGDTQRKYGDRATAESKLSPYTVGETTTAYVDPGAPAEAFLIDSRTGMGIGSVLVGAAVCLIGGAGLYQARVQARARNLLS